MPVSSVRDTAGVRASMRVNLAGSPEFLPLLLDGFLLDLLLFLGLLGYLLGLLFLLRLRQSSGLQLSLPGL